MFKVRPHTQGPYFVAGTIWLALPPFKPRPGDEHKRIQLISVGYSNEVQDA